MAMWEHSTSEWTSIVWQVQANVSAVKKGQYI